MYAPNKLTLSLFYNIEWIRSFDRTGNGFVCVNKYFQINWMGFMRYTYLSLLSFPVATQSTSPEKDLNIHWIEFSNLLPWMYCVLSTQNVIVFHLNSLSGIFRVHWLFLLNQRNRMEQKKRNKGKKKQKNEGKTIQTASHLRVNNEWKY